MIWSIVLMLLTVNIRLMISIEFMVQLMVELMVVSVACFYLLLAALTCLAD